MITGLKNILYPDVMVF